MIENDNENKLAKKTNGQWLKIHLDLLRRIWDLNIEQWNIFFLQERWYCEEVSNLQENSMKAAWLEKLTKT